MDSLSWLQAWYHVQRNGAWASNYKIKIDTLDNPGWTLEIDLSGTYLGDIGFEQISVERDEHDWFFCKLNEGIFDTAGGPLNFIEIIEVFRKWVEAEGFTIKFKPSIEDTHVLDWLQQWYYAQCDEDWEHMYGIKMETFRDTGWSVKIDVIETALEDKQFEKLSIHRDEDNWLDVWVTDGMFHGRCGPLQLTEVMGVFRKWVEEHDESIAHHS